MEEGELERLPWLKLFKSLALLMGTDKVSLYFVFLKLS